MSEHLTQAELDAFVLGALEERAMVHLTEHVRDCPACTRRLQDEARFELALPQVVARSRSKAHVSYVRVAVATAAVAAAALLTLHPWRSPEVGGPISPIVCPDGPAQSQCVAEAQQHGLSVGYPFTQGVLAGRVVPLGGPTRSPFD